MYILFIYKCIIYNIHNIYKYLCIDSFGVLYVYISTFKYRRNVKRKLVVLYKRILFQKLHKNLSVYFNVHKRYMSYYKTHVLSET